MTNYILIDGSYFIFYRVFALHVWWRNANPEIKLENPFQNEEFVEKYKYKDVYDDSITFIPTNDINEVLKLVFV